MTKKNLRIRKSILSLLFTLYSLLPASLWAVEGNEPIPEIELPAPSAKEETLKITTPYKFPCLSLWMERGKNEVGKVYEVKLNGSREINEAFEVQGLKIENKNSIKGMAEKRFISNRSITEIDAQVGGYKIEKNWNKFVLLNGSVSLYLGENTFKLFSSGGYEFKYIWDFGVLWGRNFWEEAFAGLGISGPRYMTPFIQINWMVNPTLSINISHRSKEVTTPFDSLYMYQPYVSQNPELKYQHFNKFSTIKLSFRDNISIEAAYKEIENVIFWDQCAEICVVPKNGGKKKQWEGRANLKWKKIKNITLVSFIPLESYVNPPLPWWRQYFLPYFSFIDIFEIYLPYNIRIDLESKHIKREFIYEGKALCPMPRYSLFSLMVSKKIRSWEVWGRVNNLANTKYEIIRGIEGPGTCFQTGIELTIL